MDSLNFATSTIIVNRNADLDELKNLPDVNVWGQRQDELEAQALKELEIFAKEDGELSDNSKEPEKSQNTKQTNDSKVSLDVDNYIKRQEELRKQQEYKRSLQISEKSKKAAEKISKKLNNKRKSESLDEIEHKKIKKQMRVKNDAADSGSEYCPSNGDSSDSDATAECSLKVVRQKRKSKKLQSTCSKKIIDDGSLKEYNARLDEYYKRLERETNILQMENQKAFSEHVQISSGFKVNSKIWNNLYGYQQEGIEWLWALHQKSTGGLLGDEMGLGKTVQVIAFLYSLNYSQVVSRYCRYTGLGGALIVCPTTVLHQWVQHFHEWAPEFRVAILHQSGSYSGNKTQLIKDIFKTKGILITSYAGILKHKGSLAELDWHYLILDEGHKIRNPGAKITLAVKEFRTPHRLLLTGSPMQNNLQELWSLFDFTNGGMLGSLSVFMDHFATPIMQGGYYNSTPVQEATALSMATALKNLITPYLLRRTKSEVREDISLPYKSEQVLFCSLTDEQRDLYKGYLMSEHVSIILGRGGKHWHSENYMRANVLRAITTLRKICNHPDLYLAEAEENMNDTSDMSVEDTYGYYKRSGKMVVVSALLKIWKRQKHRMLLFTQSRAMISVFEDFLNQQGYKYLKMDGTTSINSRQILINSFNQDATYDVFLLTTKVGGLGVNLTGANRVIIYDPDWNPATDTQAKERAWRIGQRKQVTIYRLLSAGTIEEKMYQRQVWKQLLSNKVLLDPRTQKFFKTSDLFDLFSLQEQTSSETANIFQNSRVSFQEKMKEKTSDRKKKVTTDVSSAVSFSEDKLEQMKILAQKIAKTISSTASSSSDNKKQYKSVHEEELELERESKAQERRYMKSLTPQQLMEYNRNKLIKEDEITNKIDNLDTNVSFIDALKISERTSNIYHDMKEEKLKLEAALNKYNSLTNIFYQGTDNIEESHNKESRHGSQSKNKTNTNHSEQTWNRNKTGNEKYESNLRSRHKKKHKAKSRDGTVTDNSGEVDGEKIDGLLKLEIKKNLQQEEKEKLKSQSQDQYVLEKLFSKKGVHTALQHETIVQSGQKEEVNKFRLHTEAESRANLALQALKQSRIKKWRW